MDGASLALTAVRGVHLAASLSAFGAASFWTLVAAPLLGDAGATARTRVEGRLLLLFRESVAVSLAAAALWLAGEAFVLSEAESIGDAADALWPMLSETRFGRILAARLALTTLGLLAMGRGRTERRRLLAAITTGVALALQVWSSHAATFAMPDRAVLLAAGALHLLAAGAWLGALTPLLAMIGALPPGQAAHAARRFSPLGALCVTVLAATAAVQSWMLIATPGRLLTTAYGLTALTKLALLVILLAFAAANRLRFVPALEGPSGPAPTSRAHLRMSIAIETGIGLAAILAAALLSDLPPAGR